MMTQNKKGLQQIELQLRHLSNCCFHCQQHQLGTQKNAAKASSHELYPLASTVNVPSHNWLQVIKKQHMSIVIVLLTFSFVFRDSTAALVLLFAACCKK
jgi:hypothetical protein